MIFHQKLRQLLLDNYREFRVYLEEILIKSSEPGVQAAAKGILWQLDSQPNLLKTNDHLQAKETLLEQKYDLMISYSHTNKDLCHQIHRNLLETKFRVWIDFESMFESTLQSMATAIESSEIVLICMSDSYKQSAYCRSEAEYAYARQRRIIPIVMEKKYRPDGWLGIICASMTRVDFTKVEFEAAFQKLLSQIQLHRQEITSIQNIIPPPLSDRKQTPLVHEDECASTIILLPSSTEQPSTNKQQVTFASWREKRT